MTPSIAPVSYDRVGAAAATGVSPDVILRAVNAGDLPVHYPSVDGRQVAKPLILADDLRAWVERGASERKTAA